MRLGDEGRAVGEERPGIGLTPTLSAGEHAHRPADKGFRGRLPLLSWMMARGNDVETALERLYRTRYRALARVAIAVTGDVDRAHDAVQEGFARAYAARAQFRGEGSLEAWVARIVLRAAAGAGPSVDALPDDLTSTVPFPERNEELTDAVAALPPRRRLIVLLRYYGDLSLRDIADTLGIAEGTVSATLTQAREELREALGAPVRRPR